jgi:hypothetical protein
MQRYRAKSFALNDSSYLRSKAFYMVIHHVFFWLKNSSSVDDRQKLIEGLETLEQITSVRKLYIGLPAATEDRSVVDSSYSVSELMHFSDLEGQKLYQDDPIHKKFIENCSHLWERVLVYDVDVTNQEV